ncbi:MAG: substrate-binding domain-containing protein [Planctomycetota bacterium]
MSGVRRVVTGVCLAGVACLLVAGCGRQEEKISVWCAAGMKPPIQALADEFEETQELPVEVTYDGANRLLDQIEVLERGDVYIAGGADYVDMAADKGLVGARRTICYLVPVIMVGKGNPKGITSLADLAGEGMRIGQGDPESAAIGRLTPKLLELNGIDRAAWQKNVAIETATVNELGVHVRLNDLAAAVVWKCIAKKYEEDCEIVEIPPEKNICPAVGGAVLTFSDLPQQSEAFLDYLTSKRGEQVLTEYGYTVEKPR